MTAVTQGAHGAVVNNLDGTVTYTPTGTYTGPDSFTFTVTDGNSNTATGTIDVAVGLLPASPVSAILDDLSDMEDQLNNPDENTVAAVTGAFAAVGGAIDTYLNDATEFISTVNIDTTGANQSFGDFLQIPLFGYQQVAQQTQSLFAIEQTLHALSVANKNLIGSLLQQYKNLKVAANPDAIQLALVEAALNHLLDLHGELNAAYWAVRKAVVTSHKESLQQYLAFKAAILAFAGANLDLANLFLGLIGPPPAEPVHPSADEFRLQFE